MLALLARRCAVASRLFVLCVLQPSALRAAAARVRCHGMPWAGVGACPAAEWKGYGGDRSPRAQDSKLGANLAFASLYRSCGFLGRLRYQMICGVGSDRVLWSGSCWAAEKRGHERTAPCGSQGDHGVSAMRIPWLSIRRRECRRWSRNGAHFGAGQYLRGGARLCAHRVRRAGMCFKATDFFRACPPAFPCTHNFCRPRSRCLPSLLSQRCLMPKACPWACPILLCPWAPCKCP